MTVVLPGRTDGIRWYEIHRWLNPFAKQRATMLTPLTPTEIEDALRPHLWSYRWSHVPYTRLHGSLKPWGFTLRRDMFRQPQLTAHYRTHPAVTELELVHGRSRWGIVGWLWTFGIWPLVVVRRLTEFWESGAFEASGPLWDRL